MSELLHASYWIASTADAAPLRPRLRGETRAEVAVIGGGIVGLTSALLLARAGRRVVLLEADRLVCGVTGHTTAKVSAVHGLKYAALEGSFGAEGAALYAESNLWALEWLAGLVASEAIACDLARTDNYVWADTAEQREPVKAEVEAATRAGLAATFVEEVPLPFPTYGALRIGDQVQFHPRRYLLAVARLAEQAGAVIHEDSRVLGVDAEEPVAVQTADGQVLADQVVVATHLPILDRGLFFAKAHPYREHVVVARVPAGDAVSGMFITAGSPKRSLRPAPHDDGRMLLICTGEKHRTGEDRATDERYAELGDWLLTRFPTAELAYQWSTQDLYPADGVPYVGRVTRHDDRIVTATGFAGWGLTNGTLAAHLLADHLQGTGNPWGSLYDAKRLHVSASAREFASENLDVAKDLVKGHLASLTSADVAQLPRGEGVVGLLDGHRVAACRDRHGQLHTVSPVCTHLGCVVAFNRGEQSWDCPCHGSRFGVDGQVLHGPAVEPLPAVEADQPS